MERDRLFVATVDWLEVAAQRTDELELVMASGRLRQLLLDSHPLVDQVNPRENRLPIRFHIIRNSKGPPLPFKADILHVYPDGLDPSILNPGAGAHAYVEHVDRDAFFKEPILVYRGVSVTVRQLILHTANVAGGVHAGKARSPEEEALDALAEEIVLHGMAAGTRCLRGIVRVTVEAMRPLRDMLANRPTQPPLT